MTTEKRIVNWNKERNITGYPDDKLIIMCKVEEMFEFLGVHKTMSKEKFKNLVKSYTMYFIEEAKAYGAEPTIEDRIDALCDDNVFNNGFIYRLGYNPEVAMDETLREIESRKGSFDSTGKWIKSESTYTADYSKAKL